ncbi:MAG: response regulator [Trueperaceae bacterium]
MNDQSPVKKPVLFAVDDEPSVLAAIARDLRRVYGERYRVLRAGSGQEALQALHELKQRGDAVALLLADQRMPEMNGVAFLGRAIELFPDAKRALLTAYADTDAAIRAIHEVRLDHYLMKPWDPPEERLYPVLDDLLDDWSASYRSTFDGLRLVRARWSPETHSLKRFLERNLVPYRWFAVEEGASTRGERVVVVGGGNSAGQAAAYLARHAERVTLVVRARTLGARPHTDWLEGVVERGAGGFIRTGIDLAPQGERRPGWTLERAPCWLESSVPGVFAAGDARHRSIKRIASAVGEGSMAVQFVHQHLAGS